MKYALMHQHIQVAILDLDDARITNIDSIQAPDHFPLGVMSMKGRPDVRELDSWLNDRSIPDTRDGLNRLSQKPNILDSYALSLSDHYWLRPEGLPLSWDAINFFHNDFSTELGDLLFGRMSADIHQMSPDATTDGWLKKRWLKGKQVKALGFQTELQLSPNSRYLLKAGSGIQQEPFNEVIASAIMERLKMPHVHYSLAFLDSQPYSVCENFLTDRTELVTAWMVLNSRPMQPEDTTFSHLLKTCQDLGMPDMRVDIEKMLTLDYIIANGDRHYNNFGFVRNAKTLKWLGFAPIFDSGTSLWHNKENLGQDSDSKAFELSQREQLDLVSDLSWYPTDLENLETQIKEIFRSPYIQEARSDAIAKAVLKRAKYARKKNFL
ncbi:MAG: HipA domain-containing protein [Clostridiales bacterium]|jgi:hypothetical protein|nr:HipA domain-containing protein [Clostridiales bacterium]